LQNTARKVQRNSLFILGIEQTHKINSDSKENNNKVIKPTGLCSFSYGSENWEIKATDERRRTTAKVNYKRKSAGYTWADYKPNTEIAKESNITQVLEKIKIQDCRRSWTQHVNRRLR